MIDYPLLWRTTVSVFTDSDIWLFLAMMAFFILLCSGEQRGGMGNQR